MLTYSLFLSFVVRRIKSRLAIEINDLLYKLKSMHLFITSHNFRVGLSLTWRPCRNRPMRWCHSRPHPPLRQRPRVSHRSNISSSIPTQHQRLSLIQDAWQVRPRRSTSPIHQVSLVWYGLVFHWLVLPCFFTDHHLLRACIAWEESVSCVSVVWCIIYRSFFINIIYASALAHQSPTQHVPQQARRKPSGKTTARPAVVGMVLCGMVLCWYLGLNFSVFLVPVSFRHASFALYPNLMILF